MRRKNEAVDDGHKKEGGGREEVGGDGKKNDMYAAPYP